MSKLQDLSDSQSKLILERINHTEKNINVILSTFEGIIKKESKFCNKIDELANKFKFISDTETFDESFGKMFEQMSTTMVHLADIKSLKVSRIEEKFLNDLMQHELVCRNTRDDAKNLISLRDFELNKRSQISLHKKTRKNILAENEVMMSNIQISKILKEIASTAEKFENQKFTDFKEILLNFILIQLKYFASGIEIMTTAYETISNIDQSSGPEQFMTELKSINKQFKKSIEQDNIQTHRFPFMRALSRFSHSTSNVDQIGRNEKSFKKRSVGKSLSTMSLNSLDSNASDGAIHKKNFPIDLLKDDKMVSDSDETDIDESSNMEPTDTEISQNKP